MGTKWSGIDIAAGRYRFTFWFVLKTNKKIYKDTLFTTWVNTLFVLQINAKQQNKHTNIKKKKGGIFGSSAENV